ncbi:hypothetical protein HY498_04135 [Candidatus Woesearchaeota archaeon]|nr:hypothetical protein [Candidatus Woesearchaeota archaeon]
MDKNQGVRKLIFNTLIRILKRDERIDLATISGSDASKKTTEISDIDLIVILKEESLFDLFIKDIWDIANNCGELISIYNTTPYHYFLIFKRGIIVDLNIITNALFWTLKKSRILFDKKGFISSKFYKIPISDEYINQLILSGFVGIIRAINKLKKKDYWVIPRFINFVRENSILPLIKVLNKDKIENITNLNLDKFPKKLKYQVYQTFAKPFEKDSNKAIISTFYIMLELCTKLKNKFKINDFSDTIILVKKHLGEINNDKKE